MIGSNTDADRALILDKIRTVREDLTDLFTSGACIVSDPLGDLAAEAARLTALAGILERLAASLPDLRTVISAMETAAKHPLNLTFVANAIRAACPPPAAGPGERN